MTDLATRALALPLSALESARGRIASSVVRTPLLAAGERLWLKPELLQPLNSFKVRYAASALATVPQGVTAIATASAGNFAQGLTRLARAAAVEVVTPGEAADGLRLMRRSDWLQAARDGLIAAAADPAGVEPRRLGPAPSGGGVLAAMVGRWRGAPGTARRSSACPNGPRRWADQGRRHRALRRLCGGRSDRASAQRPASGRRLRQADRSPRRPLAIEPPCEQPSPQLGIRRFTPDQPRLQL